MTNLQKKLLNIAGCTIILAITRDVHALSLKCEMGIDKCVRSQGTKIPSKEVVEILDRCEEFTANGIGRLTMRMSIQEFEEKNGNKINALTLAWYAYADLIDSPLKFDRKHNAWEASYEQIKSACDTLNRDFYDDSKWI